MSDVGESGDIKGSFVEDENKVDIEATSVNLGCIKIEPNEEVLEFEEDSYAKRYTITLKYENVFGESSHQIKIEEDYDNLIGFLDNDAIMENAMIKLEVVKEEDDGSFSNFRKLNKVDMTANPQIILFVDCSKCKGIYKGYCLKCSTLLRILNNSIYVNSKLNTIPTDILEIREIATGNGVYLLRTLPINVIFGPFEGILGIESTIGHSWKITDNKLGNIKSGNWMKNIDCATSASLKNLDVFQIDGNLYFQTNREITEGEELLIYHANEELQQLDNSEESLYTPQKQEKLPKIFACTMCCLGFGSNKCLMEHKRKCCWMEYSRSMKEFILIECHYCKLWMEKWEHEEYHVASCLEKHHRMSSEYSEAVDRNDANVEEMEEGDCGTRAGKRRYRGDICSRRKDRKNDLQSDTKDYQGFSGGNHETHLNDYALAERSSNEQIQNAIETNKKSRFQKHPNKHRGGIKRFKCDICLMKFAQKGHLKLHIKNRHTDDGSAKDYKCSECSYQTNVKSHLQIHLNTHSGIKPFQCDICMKKFTQIGHLKMHRKNRHTDDRGVKDYKCLDCSFHTNYKPSLQKHINTHRGIKPFKCDICLMKFGQKVHLQMHIKNKHTDDATDKDYKCLDCTFQTNYKSHLQKHLNTHRGIKPFECDICLMTFGQKIQLKSHVRNKHTDDRGVKDYKCSECSYQTNYKPSLQKHINIHLGIKPFHCDICLVKFAQIGHLKMHIKNRHTDDASAKDYKCLECSFKTNSKDHFQRHQTKHRGIKPFKCDICMVKYTQQFHLSRHIKNKHNDDGV